MVCILVACLEFKGNNKVLVTLPIIAGNLHRGVNITLQTIHRRRDMLLDFEKLVNAQAHLRAISIFNH